MPPSEMVSVEWRLFGVMADRGIRSASELARRLRDAGVDVSPAHVSRLVSNRPERLSLDILEGLLTVLRCGPEELLRPVASEAVAGGKATGTAARRLPPRTSVSGNASGQPGALGTELKRFAPLLGGFVIPDKDGSR